MNNKEAFSEFDERKTEFMEFAVASAIEAGKIHMDLYNEDQRIEWTGRVHFRAEADVRVSAMLRERLANTFPDHNVHSEESPDRKIGSPFTWVDDELDGTIPYVRRFFDGWGFARALCIGCTPVLGVIHMPLKKHLYIGVLGESSRLNGEVIHVGQASDLNKVVMSLYSGKEIRGKEEFRSSHVPFLLKAMEDPSIMTDVGFACATAALCFVADGRLDACLYTGQEDEDLAAGVVILQGAGAKVTNLLLEPWQLGNKSLLAANPCIHGQLAEKFKDITARHINTWNIL